MLRRKILKRNYIHYKILAQSSIHYVCHARARDAAKSCLELGSQKAPSTRQRCYDTACTRSVATCCVTCDVTTACLPLCATYGEGRSEHRASQAQYGHSKRQYYRKGCWAVAGLLASAAGKKGGQQIFRSCQTGDETPQAVTKDS